MLNLLFNLLHGVLLLILAVVRLAALCGALLAARPQPSSHRAALLGLPPPGVFLQALLPEELLLGVQVMLFVGVYDVSDEGAFFWQEQAGCVQGLRMPHL